MNTATHTRIAALFWLMTLSPLSLASAMPWDTPLSRLAQNLTGPTSQSVGLIALFVAGGALAFGGTLSDFGKKITWMTLAFSLMLSGGSFINLFTNGVALPPVAGGLLF
jgi:type IV secretion system protein TrbC